MISYLSALEILTENAKGKMLPIEFVQLDDSIGRVLAEPIFSQENIPSFDNSAMDGFAIRSGRAVRFQVMGSVAAGDHPLAFNPEECYAVEIMTGAPMPAGGFDAVVKVEDTRPILDSSGNQVGIEVLKQVLPSENVRFAGEDFKKGDGVLANGKRLLPQHLLSLAALGVSRVKVRKKPRVAVIATGKELIDYTAKELPPGFIRNSTAPYLMSVLAESGTDATFHGIVRDEPKVFIHLLENILADSPDIVITTGAVSMGKYDFVRPAIEGMGGKTIFHKVAIRPGKPLLFAEFSTGAVSAPVLFGIPGNPVSTAVGVRFFVQPYLRALLGLPPGPGFMAPISASFKKPEGLRCFFKGKYVLEKGQVRVSVLQGQASFMTSPLLHANSWVVLEEPGTEVSADTLVQVYPL